MSWRDAPLYVRSHDLARWVAQRCVSWQQPGSELVGAPLCEAGQALVCAAALALTFPDQRERHLGAADEVVVRLRVRLRLARDLGLLSAGGHRHAAGMLLEIGRMVGGWRRRTARRGKTPGAPTADTGEPAGRGGDRHEECEQGTG